MPLLASSFLALFLSGSRGLFAVSPNFVESLVSSGIVNVFDAAVSIASGVRSRERSSSLSRKGGKSKTKRGAGAENPEIERELTS